MQILDSLIKAINCKKPISFCYKRNDKISGTRYGNPYAIYLSKDGSKTMIHIFQTDGVSDSVQRNPLSSWRTFEIKYLKDVNVYDENTSFEIIESYNPESDMYFRVIEKV